MTDKELDAAIAAETDPDKRQALIDYRQQVHNAVKEGE